MALKIAPDGFSERQATQTQRQQQILFAELLLANVEAQPYFFWVQESILDTKVWKGEIETKGMHGQSNSSNCVSCPGTESMGKINLINILWVHK